MKVWITGESGFIAKNFTEWCDTHSSHQIINRSDEQYYDYWRNCITSYPKKEINIFDPSYERLVQMAKPDVILHCASIEEEHANKSPELAIHTNIEGSQRIAQIAHKYDIKLVYFSTAGISNNAYAISKITGELFIQNEFKNSNNYKIIRLGTVFGKYDTYSPIHKILSSIKGKEQILYANIDAYRNYLYVDDLLKYLDKAIENDYIQEQKIFVAEGFYISFEELFNLINEDLNLIPNCTINFQNNFLDREVTNSDFIDWNEFENSVFLNKINIKEGIERILEYYI